MAESSGPKPSILIQLDTDPQPSVFDGVVAVDSGVDHLFRHGGIGPEGVRDLVYGALFTRGPADLKRSAIFVGGSNVTAAEAVLEAVKKSFFAGFRVSVLFDPNGSNTTAAAAVLAALEGSGGSLQGVKTAVLAGTGPVGQRVARLLSRLGAEVAIGSRAIDLNAVPPSGIEVVKPTDKGVERQGVRCWGALGVGGTKMKIHKAAIKALFESNDRVLDAEEVLEIGQSLSRGA
jgi:hypothetical protein